MESRARLPSWISLDLTDNLSDDGRPSWGSPPSTRGEGVASPRRRSGSAFTPYTPRSAMTSSKRAHVPPSPAASSSPLWEERRLSRRTGREPTVPAESLLMGLCRQQDWKAALALLSQGQPEQAEPLLCICDEQESTVPINLPLAGYKRLAATKEEEIPLIYHETALHVVCSFAKFAATHAEESMDSPHHLLEKLLEVSPKQAIISNQEPGQTALRALLQNDTCNPKVLNLLLKSMKKNCSIEQFRELCSLPDRDDLRPMDHIVLAIQQCTCTSCSPMELLKVFVESGGGIDYLMVDATMSIVVSPLIRLLSLGNASSVARLSPAASIDCIPASSQASSRTCTPAILAHPSHHSQQVVEATKFFMQKLPFLLDRSSRTTQCTPLHVALRNYGNFSALIQCFLLRNRDDSDIEENGAENSETEETSISPLILKSLQQENQFGDLPLHVASSVGVPVPILRLVLEGTLQATASISCCKNLKEVNLCWTVNHAGYTPIDLEWIRHMEDGKGLFMARSFYPLEVGGIKKTFWKQDEFYRVLLQQAVQQAMDVKATNPFLRAFNSNNPQRIGSAHLQPRVMAGVLSTGREFDPRPAIAGIRTPRAGQIPPQQTAFQPSPPPQPSEQPTWELLLHRIFLITQTAATGQVPKTQTELVDGLLHAACKLAFPVAPSLPLPLLELILFMYSEQLLLPLCTLKRSTKRKAGKLPSACNQGNLPLHYALLQQLHPGANNCRSSLASSPNALSDRESTTEHTCNEWETWIKHLLEHGPEACSTTNDLGQLPLHKALEYQHCRCGCFTTPHSPHSGQSKGTTSQKKKKTLAPHELARLHVLYAVVEVFPDSVNAIDPSSLLMPFQMAAASPFMPLDAVFYLLRRSPDAILS